MKKEYSSEQPETIFSFGMKLAIKIIKIEFYVRAFFDEITWLQAVPAGNFKLIYNSNTLA
jgi:hypothetical protein